jgi:hypothetical protein
MLAQIGDVLPRFRIYERLFKNHERLLVALSAVYLDVLRFCIASKDLFVKARRSKSKYHRANDSIADSELQFQCRLF